MALSCLQFWSKHSNVQEVGCTQTGFKHEIVLFCFQVARKTWLILLNHASVRSSAQHIVHEESKKLNICCWTVVLRRSLMKPEFENLSTNSITRSKLNARQVLGINKLNLKDNHSLLDRDFLSATLGGHQSPHGFKHQIIRKSNRLILQFPTVKPSLTWLWLSIQFT